MSEKTSPKTRLKYGVELVCKVWKFPRSSFYQSRKRPEKTKERRGKRSTVSDEKLLQAIMNDIKEKAIAKFMLD